MLVVIWVQLHYLLLRQLFLILSKVILLPISSLSLRFPCLIGFTVLFPM